MATAKSRPRPPNGFIMGGRPEIDGWYKPEPGHVFQGKIVGVVSIQDRQVVLVRVSEPTAAVNSDKQKITLKPGQTLGVGLRAQLDEMLDYVEHRAECWVHAVEKQQTRSGNDVWIFEQAYKGKRGERPESRQPSEDYGEIPF